jgi:exopolyphosphatase/guanosine-5'-triphosphate,3'-diphosphate pyrophosphatase
MEQWRLATLLLAHRRSLKKIFTHDVEIVDWRMVMGLRLAALIHRSRAEIPLPAIDARVNGNTLRLGIALDWLAANPLTVTALHEEIEEWSAAGFKLDIKSLRELEAGTEAQAA